MTKEEYLKLGSHIWQTYVPKTGQAATVQGELLRASEKLRDEAHRNGNMNWDSGHQILATYLLDNLSHSDDLPDAQKQQLALDVAVVLNYENPYTEDDLFDRIEVAVLDWCSKNEEPVRHVQNKKLLR